ncbi:thioredoxin domain-containing protein [Lysinibacillus telephonicus]|uniref:DsbA family protein n=1 Tax=Lysinibacillus telephonicus TaxID=1714840 RepID=UPI0037CF028E
MSKKIFWIIGIIAVCLIGIIVLTDVSEKSVELSYENQPFVGEESAPVEIVEFGDYKCPHCAEFNNTLLPLIHEQFIDTGKAKFYFMNYAFISTDSTTAATFAETVYQELGNEKFWDFHEHLFANQTTVDGKENFMSEEFLEAVLAEVATAEETEQVMHAFGENKGKDGLEKDMDMANNLGVNSTPSIFIGGKKFEGMTMDDFAKMVDETANGQ